MNRNEKAEAISDIAATIERLAGVVGRLAEIATEATAMNADKADDAPAPARS